MTRKTFRVHSTGVSQFSWLIEDNPHPALPIVRLWHHDAGKQSLKGWVEGLENIDKNCKKYCQNYKNWQPYYLISNFEFPKISKYLVFSEYLTLAQILLSRMSWRKRPSITH